MEDYKSCRLTWKENIRIILKGTAMISILGILFYQSVIGIFCLSPLILLYQKVEKKKHLEERKWQLNIQFRDGIFGLSAALSAGYSAEHAFDEALKDLSLIYEEDAMIMREFAYISNQIRMNITAEKALMDFGERTGIEDIIGFSEIFTTAKRTGGDLIKIIKTTGNVISDKIDVKREIITLITAKKYEADIMKIIPVGIIGYLYLSSPGFLDPLYHNLPGALIMTLVLAVYLGAYAIIEKIVAIKV